MIIWTHGPSSNQGSFPIPKPHDGGLKLCFWTKLQPSKTFCVLMKTSSYGWVWILLVSSDLSWRFRHRIRGRFLSRSPVRVERWFPVNSVSICEYFEQLCALTFLRPAGFDCTYWTCRKKPCSSSQIHLWLNSFNPLKLFCLIYQPHLTYREFSVECFLRPFDGGSWTVQVQPPHKERGRSVLQC